MEFGFEFDVDFEPRGLALFCFEEQSRHSHPQEEGSEHVLMARVVEGLPENPVFDERPNTNVRGHAPLEVEVLDLIQDTFLDVVDLVGSGRQEWKAMGTRVMLLLLLVMVMVSLRW